MFIASPFLLSGRPVQAEGVAVEAPDAVRVAAGDREVLAPVLRDGPVRLARRRVLEPPAQPGPAARDLDLLDPGPQPHVELFQGRAIVLGDGGAALDRRRRSE